MKQLKCFGVILIVIAILFGFFTRIVAVFQYVTFDIGPDPDQIRDAFVVMGIWDGEFPLLGPRAYGLGLGGHYLLPLYYYLFFPFTIFGGDPVFQAFPNALFSFLSIPLFIFLVYKLLENIDNSQRVFFSGLAGFWYSFLFGDIFISNFQWNPSSIPFFFFSFVLLYDLQMKNEFSWSIKCFLWALNGIVFAILLSLHTSTLFVMPIVFIISIILYLFKIHKETREIKLFLLPIVSCLSTFISLIPYWKMELATGFRNSKAILQTIRSGSSSTDVSFVGYVSEKIYNLVMNYVNIMRQAYFWNSSILYLLISISFLCLITYFGIVKFKGNQYIWYIMIASLGIFLIAAANIDADQSVFYYKILVLSIPIIFAVITLAYTNFRLKFKLFIYGFTSIVLILSMINNLIYNYNFMIAKYGNNRLLNTKEIAEIVDIIPSNSSICDPRIARRRETRNKYNYINTYVVENDIEIIDVCASGNYVIHPKRFLNIESNFLNDTNYEETYFVEPSYEGNLKLWPILTVSEYPSIERSSSLFLETETAYVYILE
ncbi:hypothetical protein Cyast_1390 [Cyanobacterium stanieri PCC 7202]|uniref:Glycosyltransferase RgtA/B/C/D-like domain-containing protein n=1 Tax=Cyanobacterium stanieri (strain ATCC 29140 / PCC 7202) TaxID=292563 RepID=K9YKG4_CYASC|nr:hypothetical protein Cyast_1390 [Cyanobacterium stanieri PCC 7202]